MKQDQQNTSQGSGRISNPGTGNEKVSGIGGERDISHIDRQEGEMNNGVITRDWEHSQENKNNNKDEQGKTI